MKVGVLDIGSNSIHIVLAELGRDVGFEIFARSKDMTRLGDGTLRSGFIAAEKLDKGVAVVKQLVQLARNRGVTRILAVATAAIREAANGGEFVDRLQREAGIKVRTVTGDEEARLVYLAVRHFCDIAKRPALVLDVGGGSVEMVVGTDKEVRFTRSLKLGVARLRDLFISKYPAPRGDHERLHRHVRETLAPTLAEVERLSVQQAIVTSGTLINLGAMICERRDGHPLNGAHGFRFSLDDLKDLHERLETAGTDDLAGVSGLDPDRRDLVLPGSCLLLEVMKTLDLKAVTLCDKGIREGIILDFMAKNAGKLALEAEVPNVRLRSVLQLARRCEFEEAHARQTARLALLLYDALPIARDLHPAARELLEYSALLHDIGYHISFDAHHKHGWYIIKNSGLSGFLPEEVDIVAAAVRYHRRRAPKKRDAAMRELGGQERRTVFVLTALLRVADALDRSHFGVVESFKVSLGPRSVAIRVASKDDPALEIWTAQQKVDLLEEVLERPVRFEPTRRPAVDGETGRDAAAEARKG